VRRARTNTDREGDTGDGRAATGSRGAVDDDYYDHDDHNDVRTGRIGDRNETDCDGADAVVALLVSNACICVRVCARARARDVVVMVTVVGARERTYVDPPPLNSIRETCNVCPRTIL